MPNESIYSASDEKLVQLQQRMEMILQWAEIGVWVWQATNGSFFIPSSYLAKYGYSAEDVTPLTVEKWQSLLHPDDQGNSFAQFVDLCTGKIDKYDVNYRVRTKDGRWVWFHAVGGITRRAPDGSPLFIAGTLQDINKLKYAEEAVNRRDKLLAASNEAASILLGSSNESFNLQAWRVLDLLGRASEVDRVYIWKNRTGEDGRLYTTQVYEWSLGAEPQQGNELTVDIAYEEAIPTWEDVLIRGECINNLVRLMPKAEQDQLAPQGIISILVAPIMFDGELWGFIGFDDCRTERIWSKPEAGVLKSAGMMLASAIMSHKTENDLETERSLLTYIFDTSPVGVVITTDGIVKRANPQFLNLFETTIGESIITKYASGEERKRILGEVENARATLLTNLQYHAKDGTVRDLLITYQAIVFEDKPSYLAWTVDVTELKKTEKEISLARDLAEAGTKAKSEFLARMSHEIRTPMNAILGMVYLCLQTELAPKQKDFLLKIQTASNNLLGIIDDILDFSKIEAGKMEFEHIPFRVSNVIGEIVDLIELRAGEKGLRLQTELDETAEQRILGDPLRLRQVLVNFASNAIKFTDAGEITISATLDPDFPLPQGETELVPVRFCVRDTGIGISQEQIANIFQSFSQADGSTTRKYGGTGLGLAISRNLVQLMGGTIGVESVPGRGTTFFCSIAFPSAPLEAVHNSDESSLQTLVPRRILIVDDDPTERELVRDLVQSLGMNVETADSGITALNALVHASQTGTKFDLVLLDWKMPRMDGLETVRRMRASDEIEAIPQVLMFSAYDRSECLRLARGLGLAGFLVKPLTFNTLRETLAKLSDPRFEPLDDGGAPPINDIRGARVLLVEDNKINQLVASELLNMYGVVLTIANNGLEALEAVKKYDYDIILMDIQMPVMDGLEAAKAIRALDKPGIEKLPILAMTANAMDSDYQKSLTVGMNDHLTKPINPEKLKAALESWIARK